MKQLSLRGLVIGSIGAVIITMSSMFIALKLSSLPWPIMFVALFSMFSLKLCGNTNLNEINVTHTVMSAGAMVAGGLAFTLPGIWMLDPEAQCSPLMLGIISFSGVTLGLIFTALIRKYFVVDNEKDITYPMGVAAANTLITGDKGGKKAALLFSSMAIAAVFTFVRDWLAKIPAVLWNQKMMSFGSLGGVWLSPMLVAVGYIIGPVAIGVWFLGAVIGDFGILIAGQSLGLYDGTAAADIKSSLGIGMMVGTGAGIIIKGIMPKAKDIYGALLSREHRGDSILSMRWAPFAAALIAVLLTTVCNMGIISSLIVILGAWLTTAMSAMCVGQSGINPMEIFGIIILLAAKAVSDIGQMESFFAAAVIAVACGLVGDVMNDFKSGHILKTDPKKQWIGECIGGYIGALVSVIVLIVILKAYGPEAFGSEMFPAAQAGAVAAMVGGIANVPAFIAGFVIAAVLYCLRIPVMTLGLGVYLPFYLSATAFIGGLIRFICDRFFPEFEEKGTGSIIAAGLLGGEAIVGVIIALVIAVQIVA